MASTPYDFDLFVIGAGSGGVRAGRVSAQKGARVAVAEEDSFGGTCVVRGCIPKKLFVYASSFAEEFEDASGFGWTVEGARFDWPALIANKDREIERISGVYRSVLEKAGATIFEDRATLKDAHCVRLNRTGREVTAETILIATGGYPSRETEMAGAEFCITSNEAFHLEKFPERIVIVGGGYIAVEFAHIFHGLGAEVTLVYRGPKVLRGFDEDLRDCLQASMQKKRMRLLLDTKLAACERAGGCLRVTTAAGEILEADQVMLAVGRRPNVAGLGLQAAGIATIASGHIDVDRYSRTSVPNVYAIGDVTGRLELTPVALHEAMCFVDTVFGGKPSAPDHELVATAVFTRPEIGTVGLTDERALKRGHTIDIYKTSFKPLKHTLSGRDERSMMKLVVDAKTDRVLGCHIFSAEAGEMAQLVAIALKMGATKAQFDATVSVHPTMAEELVTLRTKTATRSPGSMIIKTPRLTLRDWQQGDRDSFAALHADPEVMRDYGAPFSPADVNVKFPRYKTAFSAYGFCRWVIENSERKFIGYAGLLPAFPGHPLGPHVDIGWRLVRSAWGHGYATEAAKAALQDGFDRVGLKEVLAYTDADNSRSQAVIKRLDLRREPSLDFSSLYDGKSWHGLVWIARPFGR